MDMQIKQDPVYAQSSRDMETERRVDAIRRQLKVRRLSFPEDDCGYHSEVLERLFKEIDARLQRLEAANSD